MPRDLIDAARLAGLGPLRVWWQVVLPLTRRTALAVAALAFVAHWGNFIEPLLYLYDTAKATLPMGLSSLRQLGPTDAPVLLAGSRGGDACRRCWRSRSRSGRCSTTRGGRDGSDGEGGGGAACAGLSARSRAAATTSRRAAGDAEKAVPAITFQVTGDPEETQVYKELAEQYKTETGRTVNIVEVPERDAHLAKLTTQLLGRQGARGLPAQLPLPRRLRRQGRDRPGRPAAGQLGGVRPRGLLPAAAEGLRVRRRAPVHPAERLEPRRLLQRRRVPRGRDRRRRRTRGPTRSSPPRPTS